MLPRNPSYLSIFGMRRHLYPLSSCHFCHLCLSVFWYGTSPFGSWLFETTLYFCPQQQLFHSLSLGRWLLYFPLGSYPVVSIFRSYLLPLVHCFSAQSYKRGPLYSRITPRPDEDTSRKQLLILNVVVSAQYILAIGALCVTVSTILVATMPAQQSYWPQLFPATILMAFCPDFIFTAAQIIASNSVKRNQQGIAGSLIGTIITYGQSIGLGFAGTVEKYTTATDANLEQGYRNALYFGIGLGVAALLLDLFLVRVAADTQEGWKREEESSEGIQQK